MGFTVQPRCNLPHRRPVLIPARCVSPRPRVRIIQMHNRKSNLDARSPWPRVAV